MLLGALLPVGTQSAMEQGRVQFVIAHDGDSTGVDQTNHAVEDGAVAGPLPSVDEVT